MDNQMTIRNFVSEDMAQCFNLFVDVFNGEPWNDKWTKERAEQYLMDYVNAPGFKGVVAKHESRMHGFLFGISKRWWSGDEFFVNEMCVKTDAQRRGIGTALLQYLESDLKESGIESVTLLTNRDIPAEHFYMKNGFSAIDRLVFLAKRI